MRPRSSTPFRPVEVAAQQQPVLAKESEPALAATATAAARGQSLPQAAAPEGGGRCHKLDDPISRCPLVCAVQGAITPTQRSSEPQIARCYSTQRCALHPL